MIKINDLNFSYTSEPFIQGLSLHIDSGEFVMLLGKNGSGKSTLIKLLFGIENFSQGEILVDGYSIIEEIYNARKIMGMVFQNPDDQIVSDIVETDVAFAMENYGYPVEEIRKNIDRVLELVGLLHKKQEKISTLSGGEKQRLCIASSMVLNPKILVLDEATSMLDTRNRESIMSILEEINSKGVTIIIVTHHLNEIKYGKRVVLMDRGSITFDGKRDEFVKDIIKGENSYNLNLPTSFKIACEMYKRKGIDISDVVFDIKKAGEIICRSL